MSTDQSVQIKNLSFRCRVDGSGDDKPWIVFSNSLLTDLSVWDAQVVALRDKFQVLRYDQRGHGGTGVSGHSCNFDDLGGDVLALMDHFGVGRCSFVGLSMGVTTALQVMSSHPERVERLVLSDGQSQTAPGGAETWAGRIEQARKLGMKAVADTAIERWFSPEFIASGKAEAVREVAAAVSLEGYSACAGALQDYQYSHVLSSLAVPTLIMAGANDGNMPNSMREMCDAIPGAVMHVVPDAGHIPNVESADIFNRHLSEFLL